MPLQVGLWRIDDNDFRVVPGVSMPSEQRLEDLIEADPTVLGERLLVVARQVITDHGKRIDLLAVDADGDLHILELKRDRTPRDVVAQILDYGSWVIGLSHDDVLTLYSQNHAGAALEADFEETFGVTPPEQWNTSHHLTIVAADLDADSQRIVTYLAEQYAVPINVVFFRYFTDGDREYVARTWLINGSDDTRHARGASGPKPAWSGEDWYVNFGDDPSTDRRSWEDARRYGFVSAGGGDWYSRTLRSLPIGATIWVYLPKTGYVGVGTVTGVATPIGEATVTVDGQPIRLLDLPLEGSYRHDNAEVEWMVPVHWHDARPREQAVWRSGMFANQNSACKLRNRYTLDHLLDAFGNPRATSNQMDD